jgi:phage repressor protein C with HTH and peptisase S24 domain
MAPEIVPGAPMAYEPTDTLSVDAIYVLKVNGDRHIMRIQPLGGGAFRALPENEAYDREIFKPLEAGDWYRSEKTGLKCRIKVIGRVTKHARFV